MRVPSSSSSLLLLFFFFFSRRDFLAHSHRDRLCARPSRLRHAHHFPTGCRPFRASQVLADLRRFPISVAPTTTTTWWCSRRYKTSRRCLRMGAILVKAFFVIVRLCLLLPLSSLSSSSSSFAPRADERQRPKPLFFQVDDVFQ